MYSKPAKIETIVGKSLGNGQFERFVNGYKLTNILGSGAFGVVSLGEKNFQQFAIKVYNLVKLQKTPHFEKLMELIKSEVVALQQLKHPNIMQIHDHFESKKNIYLVLKLYKDGDMLDYIQRNGFLSEQKVMQLMPQVVSALKFAADRRTMHRDIKLENLFMDGDMVVVGDFGLAKVLDEKVTYTVLGTKPFMAPEFQFNEGYSFVADVWALGVNMYMSIFGKDPWSNSEYKVDQRTGKLKLYPRVNPTRLSTNNCGKKLPFPFQPIISDNLKNIFRLMVEYDPNTRIGWDQLSIMLNNNQPLFNFPQQAPLIGRHNQMQLEQINEIDSDIGSEILERHTFQQSKNQATKNDISAAYRILAAFKQNQQNLSQAKYFDLLLTEMQQYGQGNAQSMFDPLLQTQAAKQKAEEEAVEQYILFYTYICDFFLQVCEQLNFNAQNQVAYNSLKGVMSILVNYVSKKTIQIANYFIKKLSQGSGHFSVINMKYEFYQNGFAKQYLSRFDEIYGLAAQYWSISIEPAKTYLPPLYHDRSKHLESASNQLVFSAEEEFGFNLAMMYMFSGLEKFSSTFQKPQLEEGKRMLAQLSTICHYKDTLIFKAENDQFENLARELEAIHDPSRLEYKYQQDRMYFKQWKEQINNR